MPIALFVIGGVLAFVYGTVIGSFLNVCIYRLPIGESLLYPPSHCPRCQTRLRPVDLIPLLSYLALRRKCRYCGTRISPRYFTIELCTGALFLCCWLALAQRFPDTLWTSGGLLLLIASCVFVATMLVTFVIDLETTYVFEPVTWVAMGAGIVFEVTDKLMTGREIAFTLGGTTIPYLPAAVPGMIIGFLLFIAMDIFGGLIFRKPSMGLGDAYIGAAIGAMLGPALALLSFGMAVAVGAVVGIVFLAVVAIQERKRANTRGARPDEAGAEDEAAGHRLPIVPFLVSVAALGAVWLVEGYLGVLVHEHSGGASPAMSAVLAVVFAAVVGVMLVFLGRLWPDQEIELDEVVGQPAGQDAEDEAPMRYMPFGPFLTASAVLVAWAPDWFWREASRFFHWWFFQNPML